MIIEIIVKIFFAIGMLSTASAVSFVFVSMMYARSIKKDDDDEESIQYQWLYLEEFEKLENTTEIDYEKLQDCILSEHVPEIDGMVVMRYSVETASFWYYCDTKDVKYNILDALARKFAIKFNCKAICVNYMEEYEKAVEEYRNPSPPSPTIAPTGPYVSLKTYHVKKRHIIPNKANRFSYKGKIEQSAPIPPKPTNNLSFADYKNSRYVYE